VIAGLVAAAVMLPKAMAYATVAGLPVPHYVFFFLNAASTCFLIEL
jgi:MFS superfamily sulfate permease-like transporter